MGGGGSSSSASSSSTTTAQTTGASASYSPTVSAGGNVTLTDEGATEQALAGMAQVVQAALNQQTSVSQSALGELSDFNANQSAAQVQQSQSEMQLLSSVLANNQTLASNVQSGGATTGMDLTTKVVIGALALMGLLVVALLFRK